ncbi:hypothetical protein ABK040_016869 [Willaertia magna]
MFKILNYVLKDNSDCELYHSPGKDVGWVYFKLHKDTNIDNITIHRWKINKENVQKGLKAALSVELKGGRSFIDPKHQAEEVKYNNEEDFILKAGVYGFNSKTFNQWFDSQTKHPTCKLVIKDPPYEYNPLVVSCGRETSQSKKQQIPFTDNSQQSTPYHQQIQVDQSQHSFTDHGQNGLVNYNNGVPSSASNSNTPLFSSLIPLPMFDYHLFQPPQQNRTSQTKIELNFGNDTFSVNLNDNRDFNFFDNIIKKKLKKAFIFVKDLKYYFLEKEKRIRIVDDEDLQEFLKSKLELRVFAEVDEICLADDDNFNYKKRKFSAEIEILKYITGVSISPKEEYYPSTHFFSVNIKLKENYNLDLLFNPKQDYKLLGNCDKEYKVIFKNERRIQYIGIVEGTNLLISAVLPSLHYDNNTPVLSIHENVDCNFECVSNENYTLFSAKFTFLPTANIDSDTPQVGIYCENNNTNPPTTGYPTQSDARSNDRPPNIYDQNYFYDDNELPSYNIHNNSFNLYYQFTNEFNKLSEKSNKNLYDLSLKYKDKRDVCGFNLLEHTACRGEKSLSTLLIEKCGYDPSEKDNFKRDTYYWVNYYNCPNGINEEFLKSCHQKYIDSVKQEEVVEEIENSVKQLTIKEEEDNESYFGSEDDRSTVTGFSDTISTRSIVSFSSYNSSDRSLKSVRIINVDCEQDVTTVLDIFKNQFPEMVPHIVKEKSIKRIDNPQFPKTYFFFINFNDSDVAEMFIKMFNGIRIGSKRITCSVVPTMKKSFYTEITYEKNAYILNYLFECNCEQYGLDFIEKFPTKVEFTISGEKVNIAKCCELLFPLMKIEIKKNIKGMKKQELFNLLLKQFGKTNIRVFIEENIDNSFNILVIAPSKLDYETARSEIDYLLIEKAVTEETIKISISEQNFLRKYHPHLIKVKGNVANDSISKDCDSKVILKRKLGEKDTFEILGNETLVQERKIEINKIVKLLKTKEFQDQVDKKLVKAIEIKLDNLIKEWESNVKLIVKHKLDDKTNNMKVYISVFNDDDYFTETIEKELKELFQTNKKIIILQPYQIDIIKRNQKLLMDLDDDVVISFNEMKKLICIIALDKATLESICGNIYSILEGTQKRSKVITFASWTEKKLFEKEISQYTKNNQITVISVKKELKLIFSGTSQTIDNFMENIAFTVLAKVRNNIYHDFIEVTKDEFKYLTGANFRNYIEEVAKVNNIEVDRIGDEIVQIIKCNSTFIYVVKKDTISIASIVDVIVNNTNTQLDHTGSIAKTIADKAGERFVQDSKQKVQKNGGSFKTSDVITTISGNLNRLKCIYNAIPPIYNGNSNDKLLLEQTINNILDLASKDNITSIAIPPLSMDIFHYPIDEATQVIASTIINNLKSKKTNLSKIYLTVLEDDKDIVLEYVNSFNNICTPIYQNLSDQDEVIEKLEIEYGVFQYFDDLKKRYVSYSANENKALCEAYEKNPTGIVQIKGEQEHNYIIDFDNKIQTNTTTNFSRKIRYVPHEKQDAFTAIWMWKNDNDWFTPFKENQCKDIERGYNEGKIEIVIMTDDKHEDMEYRVSFSNNGHFQYNIKTQHKREVIRYEVNDIRICNIDHSSPPLKKGDLLCVIAEHQGNLYCVCHTNYFSIPKSSTLPYTTHKTENIIMIIGEKNNITNFKICHQNKMQQLIKTEKLPALVTLNIIHQLLQKHKIFEKKLTFQNNQNIIAVSGFFTVVDKFKKYLFEEIVNNPVISANNVYPPYWEPQTDNTKKVELDVNSQEYVMVSNRLKLTLPNASITKIERIQNKVLFKSFRSEVERISEQNNGTANVRHLFHGTRGTDPEFIYNGQDGFDTRFSSAGMWGRGVYFAENASFSNNYAFTDNQLGCKVIFLVDVLLGDYIQIPSDNSLVIPPIKTNTKPQIRYDSVKGNTGGSDVYIIYANSRAYPSYLIYYQ